jgi:hypothetical protein
MEPEVIIRRRCHSSQRETLAGLGLKRVFDFRSPEESRARPDQLPPGVTQVALDVLDFGA